jgi:hypothetical protein
VFSYFIERVGEHVQKCADSGVAMAAIQSYRKLIVANRPSRAAFIAILQSITRDISSEWLILGVLAIIGSTAETSRPFGAARASVSRTSSIDLFIVADLTNWVFYERPFHMDRPAAAVSCASETFQPIPLYGLSYEQVPETARLIDFAPDCFSGVFSLQTLTVYCQMLASLC